MKKFILLLTAALAAVAQQTQSLDGPPLVAYEKQYGYSGSNVIYICTSPSFESTGGQRFLLSTAISAATNANPVVFTSTGHGLPLNSRPQITISGGTGNWAAVNGTFVATVIDANTFSIPVDSTTFGAVTGSLVFQSTGPRTNQPHWAVQIFNYTGANVISSYWLLGSTGFNAKCSDGTSTTVQVQ